MPPFNPDPVDQPSFRPQHPVRLSDMRRMYERAAQIERLAITGGIADVGGDMGLQIGGPELPDGFWARLTTPIESDGNPWYSFIEVQDDGTGKDWTTPNGAAEQPFAAFEINKNKKIPVPGPPAGLAASLVAGGSLASGTYYYVVTATWINLTDGNSYQSGLSSEVSETPTGGDSSVELSWTAPVAAVGFVLSGYAVWRGTSAGGENVEVATVAVGTTTYMDTGGVGSEGSPVLGGTAGPVVWMSPLAALGFYKFSYEYVPPVAWVKVTDLTLQTVTLPTPGDTLQGYKAYVDTWDGLSTDGTSPDFVDQPSGSPQQVWFVGVNGEVPTKDSRYRCTLLGVDADGVAIWGAEALRTEIAILNSPHPDPDTGLYDATIRRYDPVLKAWDPVEDIWVRDANEIDD